MENVCEVFRTDEMVSACVFIPCDCIRSTGGSLTIRPNWFGNTITIWLSQFYRLLLFETCVSNSSYHVLMNIPWYMYQQDSQLLIGECA